MEDGLFVKIVIPEEVVTLQNIKQWIDELVLFNPDKMRTKQTERKFKLIQLHRELEKIFSNDDVYFQLDLKNDTSYFTLTKGVLQLPSILCMYSKSVYEKISVNEIADKFTVFFQMYNGIVGYAVSCEDQQWQNKTDIEAFIKSNKSLEHVTFKPHFILKDREMIDIESFPGHNHFSREGIWFGSTWSMWFGERYYSFIPKDKLLSFSDGYKNSELSDGSISIVLYENVWEYDKPSNRAIQWQFRKVVGIDEVAHKVTKKIDRR
ncbi:hypothetical protein [Paenibacillus harenae]|uniref:hypothetical protein n=1 Tax=Paenibacillus harenae TaxID=306543 RepID=UPI0004006BD2|nr:hypothetical protein [Paenibacillus harenae]